MDTSYAAIEEDYFHFAHNCQWSFTKSFLFFLITKLYLGPTTPGRMGAITPGRTPGATTPGRTPGATTPGRTPGATTPGRTPGATTPGRTPGATTPGRSARSNLKVSYVIIDNQKKAFLKDFTNYYKLELMLFI